MVWVKLDDRFAEHPKVESLSDSAFRAHVWALCYCGRNETDGFVPDGAARRRVAAGDVGELVGARLWDPAPGGFVVHDFLAHNPTKAEIDSRREARSEAGKKGAARRWDKAGRMASAMAPVMAKRCDFDAPSPSPSPYPVPVPEPAPQEYRSPTETSSVSASPKPDPVAEDDIAKFVRLWNETVAGSPVPALRPGARPSPSRCVRIRGWLTEARRFSEGDPWASTLASMRWFAQRAHASENGDVYGVDTFLRASHREKYLEAPGQGRNRHRHKPGTFDPTCEACMETLAESDA
jgi:hypothetical protein